MKILALFDFDGTLTNKDSLFHFIKFAVGSLRFYAGLLALSPLLLGLKINLVHTQKAKEKLIYFYLKHISQSALQKIVEAYTLSALPLIFRKTALARLAWHREHGHQVCIVSASADLWLAEWCKRENIQLIATKLAFENNTLQEKFASPNCNGAEKVNRIKSEIDITQFESIFAYGDTKGDREMLALAHKPHFQYFKD